MRSEFSALAVALAACGVVSGQTPTVAPVPANPLELVTGETRIPASAAERGALVSLLDRTMDNHNMHARNGAPFTLNLNLTVTASTLYPAASGVMQESWISADNWRWSTTLGGFSQLQLSSNGAVYNQNPTALPIRLREIRQAVFAPAIAALRQATIRTAGVLWNGKQITCVLLSAGGNNQVPAQGRQWYEREFCIDPASATLQIFSEAPGIYMVYDYANGLHFHTRLLPGKVTVWVKGANVAEAQLTSIADANPADPSLYTASSEMVAKGPAPVMGPVERFARFPMIVIPADMPSGFTIEPMIIHVTMDAQGNVQESESLQNAAMSAEALDRLRAEGFPPSPQPAGASARLREAYVNVQFRPAVEALVH